MRRKDYVGVVDFGAIGSFDSIGSGFGFLTPARDIDD
jgi:hypothetical protein